jgi:hypothetical protein
MNNSGAGSAAARARIRSKSGDLAGSVWMAMRSWSSCIRRSSGSSCRWAARSMEAALRRAAVRCAAAWVRSAFRSAASASSRCATLATSRAVTITPVWVAVPVDFPPIWRSLLRARRTLARLASISAGSVGSARAAPGPVGASSNAAMTSVGVEMLSRQQTMAARTAAIRENGRSQRRSSSVWLEHVPIAALTSLMAARTAAPAPP